MDKISVVMAHGSPCIQGSIFWTPPPPIAFLATHHAGASATVTATASSTSTAAAEATAAAAVHVLVDWACEKGYPKELVLEAFANATATAYVSAYASIYATTSSTGWQSLSRCIMVPMQNHMPVTKLHSLWT